MALNLGKHHFTVSEYERMGETGVLSPDARFELIAGEIVEMSPIGSRHAACVTLLSRILNKQVHDNAIIGTQNPVHLDDFSEPQPDIAVLRYRDDFYRDAHPRAQDVLLVIEVAETTLDYDRQVKMPLYARAGIPEALVFNLPDHRVEYYSQPEAGKYTEHHILRPGQQFISSTVAGLTLDVGAILD